MRPTKADNILRATAQADQALAQTIAGVAIALEAMESLLVEKGIIGKDDVIARIKQLVDEKVKTPPPPSASPQADGDSRIIIP